MLPLLPWPLHKGLYNLLQAILQTAIVLNLRSLILDTLTCENLKKDLLYSCKKYSLCNSTVAMWKCLTNKLSRLNFPNQLAIIIKSLSDSEYEQKMKFLQGSQKTLCHKALKAYI